MTQLNLGLLCHHRPDPGGSEGSQSCFSGCWVGKGEHILPGPQDRVLLPSRHGCRAGPKLGGWCESWGLVFTYWCRLELLRASVSLLGLKRVVPSQEARVTSRSLRLLWRQDLSLWSRLEGWIQPLVVEAGCRVHVT